MSVVWFGKLAVLQQLAWSWLKVGILGFGGGPALIPLVQADVVAHFHWMTEEEFMELLALSYSLPGPISAKLSVSIGYEQAGILGALISFLAVMAPSIVMITALSGFFYRHHTERWMIGLLKAIKPVVIALLTWTVIKLVPNGVSSWTGGLILVGSLAALWMRVPPAVVILVGGVIGAVLLR